MTPKEKAIELTDKFYSKIPMSNDCKTGCMSCIDKCGNMVAMAKSYSEIVVDEILAFDLKAKSEAQFVIERRIEEYWQEVKVEIEKL